MKLKDDHRRVCPVPRHTEKWKKLYVKRVSVERVFSRLKKDGDGAGVTRGLVQASASGVVAAREIMKRAGVAAYS